MGLYWGYIGIMEKKMEATIQGLVRAQASSNYEGPDETRSCLSGV